MLLFNVYVAFDIFGICSMTEKNEEQVQKKNNYKITVMTKMFLLSFAACLELAFCSVKQGIRH